MPKDDEVEVSKQKKRALKEEITSMVILKRVDKKGFWNPQTSLKNSYLLGKNEYSTTISDLLKVLNKYKPEWTPRSNHTRGHSFLQMDGPEGSCTQIKFLGEINGKFFCNTRCLSCNLLGHSQKYCPVVTDRSRIRLDNSRIGRNRSFINEGANEAAKTSNPLDLDLLRPRPLQAVPLEGR